MSKRICDLTLPDLRSVDSGKNHDYNRNDQSLGRPIEISEIQCMRMVCLPCREEHWQARDQSRKSPELCRTKAHCGGVKHAGKGAIKRVDSMIK